MEALQLGSRFQVRRSIGRGGMGEVYEVLDRERRELVALKTLREMSPGGIYRLKQEFRTLANLRHPNLVALHELVTTGESWFFTMELVDGWDFLDFVRPVGEMLAGELPSEERSAVEAQGTAAASDQGGPWLVEPGETMGATAHLFTSPELTLAEPETAVLGDGPSPRRPRRRLGPLDEERLRHALAQLVSAVCHLHQAGYLHRDIKPSNILVDGAWGVRLCDFGLATELRRASRDSDGAVEGTIPYMSPEQASGLLLSEASDWYSVGVLLYQSLTGELPHPGEGRSALLRKQSEPSRPVLERAPDAPRDLARLCDALLAIEPEKRPAGEFVSSYVLGDGANRVPSTLSTTRDLFVGRTFELAQLEDAYRAVVEGRPLTAFVHGISGMGKSAVVRRFLDRVGADERAIVLSGRCYENEDVPYKAFDGVVDALSTFLNTLPGETLEALVPEGAGELCRLFPVLRRIPHLARVEPQVDVRDPQELRTRAMVALRDLLGRLAEHRHVVICIDDLHWGDADSGRLMRALRTPPHAPPLLLLATYRREARDESPLLRDLLRDQASGRSVLGEVRDVGVEPLEDDDARALATALLPGSEPNRVFDAIVKEAGGSPFFLAELARLASSGSDASYLTVRDVVASRLAQLPAKAQRLLAHVAVAGHPLPMKLVLEAAALERAGGRAIVASLRVDHLVRTMGARQEDVIEAYHDRIREAVVAGLDAEAFRTTNENLAWAVERAGGGDPELLMRLWRDAGQGAKASRYAEAAAQRASHGLAFERAAELYRAALRLVERPEEETRRLRVAVAEALANSGRGAEAALGFLDAVEGASAADALELRRRAAEQWLYSGHSEHGMEAIDRVLGAVGLRLAKTSKRALASYVWGRTVTALRGTSFTPRDATQVSAEELRRVDVLWSASTGLSVIDHVRSADLQTRHLRAALATGERYRISRALSLEAAHVASMGVASLPKARALFDRALALAEETGDPHAIGFAHLAGGASSLLCGEWRRAFELCTQAEQLFRSRCIGVTWELATTNIYALGSLIPLGELRILASRVPESLREAEARGNLHAILGTGVQVGTVASLGLDDPDRAHERVVVARSQRSLQAFHIQDLYELGARIQIALYRGDGEDAVGLVREHWSALEASLLLRVEWARIEMSRMRALSHLWAHHARPDPAHASTVRRIARRLGRERPLWGQAHGDLLEAGLACLEGARDAARQGYGKAAEGFEQVEMPLMAACARLRAAELGEGDADAQLERIAALGARRPDRMVRVFAPPPCG